MGKGGKVFENGHTKNLTWDEIRDHNKRDDNWLVISGKVYNVTNFMKRHPGGARIMSSYGGQDATDVWTAMHNNKEYVAKYMKPLFVGEVATSKTELEEDFRQLRKQVEESDLLKVDPIFYLVHFISILSMDILGYLILSRFGPGWGPYWIAAICFLVAQAQAGWLQHDFGHLSVFNNRKLNHVCHQFLIGIIKGASSHWWNFRHSLHHAKPNVIKKDPDIDLETLFLIGEVMPKIYGQKKRGFMPYSIQHIYLFFFTPLLMPVYFLYDNFSFVFKRRDYWDLFFMITFFCKLYVALSPIVGGFWAFGTFFFVRTLESHWFVWCTQMSHIPNEVDFDHSKEWFRLQLDSTCNVEPGLFNDWFSGHLNYQIEHHLFPTMPRHNYRKVAPLVMSLCKKHGVKYRCKSLSKAFADIVRSLAHSGELWYNAYYEGLDSVQKKG